MIYNFNPALFFSKIATLYIYNEFLSQKRVAPPVGRTTLHRMKQQ